MSALGQQLTSLARQLTSGLPTNSDIDPVLQPESMPTAMAGLNEGFSALVRREKGFTGLPIAQPSQIGLLIGPRLSPRHLVISWEKNDLNGFEYVPQQWRRVFDSTR